MNYLSDCFNGQIMDGVTKGVDVTVSVMLEGGEEHICHVKYS